MRTCNSRMHVIQHDFNIIRQMFIYVDRFKKSNEINDSLGCRPVAQLQRSPPVGPVFKGWDLEKTGLRWDRAPPDLVRQVATDGAQPSCALRVCQIRTIDIQEPLNVARRELWWPWCLATMQPLPKSSIQGEKRQTIKSALYQQKEFLTVPLGASQTAPSVAKTVTHNTPGCCRNNFCSSQIVEISTLNAMIQKCWNWPFPEALGASCATAGRAIAQLASSVVLEARWGKLRYSTAGGSTTRLRVAQPGSNNVAFSVQVALSRGQLRYGTAGGSTTSPQISVSEVGKIEKLKATEEASSAKPRGTVSNCLGYRGCCFRSTQEYCEQLTVLATGESASFPNYFTSCDPHHDIYPFCYWQIFWHSIWHIFWHSIWHIFWHSTWHIFWHIFWHTFGHSIWHFIWHSIWHTFWHSIWQTFWHFIWHICWHSIWHFTWHSIWHTFGHSIWHTIWQIFWYSIWQTFWHSIWHISWHFIWHIFWHSIWHSIWHLFWHSIWPWAGSRLRPSGAHSAGQVPGWGPAVHAELGRFQVEVQRCTLSWAGPRFRSSGAH